MPKYELAAVIEHHGRGIDTGHYTSYTHDSFRDTWLHNNDTRVKVVTPKEVQQAQAYLLFYVDSAYQPQPPTGPQQLLQLLQQQQQ